jgi:hypothetical protein
MTARADERREGIAARVGFATALFAAVAIAAVARDAQSRQTTQVSGPVVSGWSEAAERVAEIEVETAAGTLTVDCAEEVCRIRERGGHPVDPGALARFDRALGSLRYAERKTGDPEKLRHLGLGAPSDGGKGVIVRVRDADGGSLADLVIGSARRAGGLYVRAPDDSQAFAVDGERPAVADAASWLDLEFLPFARGDIAAVDVEPAESDSYRLARSGPGAGDFALENAPGWTLLTVGAANPTGGALERFKFEDVMLAEDLAGEPAARHVATSFDGLTVALDIYDHAGGSWAVVRTEASAPEAELAAERLAARTAGWAYKLPGFAGERLARPLEDIARRDED